MPRVTKPGGGELVVPERRHRSPAARWTMGLLHAWESQDSSLGQKVVVSAIRERLGATRPNFTETLLTTA